MTVVAMLALKKVKAITTLQNNCCYDLKTLHDVCGGYVAPQNTVLAI